MRAGDVYVTERGRGVGVGMGMGMGVSFGSEFGVFVFGFAKSRERCAAVSSTQQRVDAAMRLVTTTHNTSCGGRTGRKGGRQRPIRSVAHAYSAADGKRSASGSGFRVRCVSPQQRSRQQTQHTRDEGAVAMGGGAPNSTHTPYRSGERKRRSETKKESDTQTHITANRAPGAGRGEPQPHAGAERRSSVGQSCTRAAARGGVRVRGSDGHSTCQHVSAHSSVHPTEHLGFRFFVSFSFSHFVSFSFSFDFFRFGFGTSLRFWCALFPPFGLERFRALRFAKCTCARASATVSSRV